MSARNLVLSQGYHTGHAGVVALKAVNTVLCMIYANCKHLITLFHFMSKTVAFTLFALPVHMLHNVPQALEWSAVYNQVYRRGTTGVSGTVVTSTALNGVSEKRIKTALAGFVLLSICNMLLLAVLGTAPTATNTYNNKEVTSARGAQMTHTQSTSAYPTTAAAPAHAGMGVGQTGVVGAGQTVV